MKAIILAQGDQSRMQEMLGKPKQLLDVRGEPIIGRAVRLLREREVKDIVVVAPSTAAWVGFCQSAEVRHYTIARMGLYFIDSLRELRSEFSEDGQTIVAYGDVIYSPHVIAALVDPGPPITFAVRKTPSGHLLRKDEEIYGFSFNQDVRHFLGEMLAPKRVQISPYHIAEDVWGLYYYFSDEESTKVFEVPAEDYTNDIDYLEDVQRIPLIEEAL